MSCSVMDFNRKCLKNGKMGFSHLCSGGVQRSSYSSKRTEKICIFIYTDVMSHARNGCVAKQTVVPWFALEFSTNLRPLEEVRPMVPKYSKIISMLLKIPTNYQTHQRKFIQIIGLFAANFQGNETKSTEFASLFAAVMTPVRISPFFCFPSI